MRVICVPPAPAGSAAERERAALDATEETLEHLRRGGPLDLLWERYSLWGGAGTRCARERGLPSVLKVNAPLTGTIAFDELRATTTWAELAGLDALFPSPGIWMLAGTAGLVGCTSVVAVTYLAALGASPVVADLRAASSPSGWFAACLLPIAAAYSAAHSISLLVVDGRRDYLLASEVLAWGWGAYDTTLWMLTDPVAAVAAVALVQLGAIVLGHVLGVVVAHDRALAGFPAAERLRGQYPLLLVMAAWAFGGITLLAGA